MIAQHWDKVVIHQKVKGRAAIIGAGMAGLTAAHGLKNQGWSVELFDKGRSPGGRIATRRCEIHGRSLGFDHGARFITIHDQNFSRFLEPLLRAGSLQRWVPRWGEWRNGSVTELSDPPDTFVGVPGMSAVPRTLAEGLTVHSSAKVVQILRGSTWSLTLDSGAVLSDFDTVIVAIPDVQARNLLVASELGTVTQNLPTSPDGPAHGLAPCWTVMLAFAQKIPCQFDAITSSQSPIAWAVRNSSKPGRTDDHDTWVLHLNARASLEHLEKSKQDIEHIVLDALQGLIPETQGMKPVLSESHRWRYALMSKMQDVEGQASSHSSIYVQDLRLGFCGDWLGRGQIEAAWQSGVDISEQILNS